MVKNSQQLLERYESFLWFTIIPKIFEQIGNKGRSTTKSWKSSSECLEEAKKLIKKKERAGYEEEGSDSESSEEETSKPPPKKRQRTTKGATKKTKGKTSNSNSTSNGSKSKRKRKKAKESSSSESSDDEDRIKSILKNNGEIYFENDDNNKYFKVVIDGRKYKQTTGTIGKRGGTKSKSFGTKNTAINKAVKLCLSKMEDGYVIIEDDDEEEEEESDVSMSDKDEPLKGKKICISGSFKLSQSAVKKKVTESGATLKSSCTKDLDLLLVGNISPVLTNSKALKAKGNDTPIIKFDWLLDCIDEGKCKAFKGYYAWNPDDESESESDDNSNNNKNKNKKKSKSKYASSSDDDDDSNNNTTNNNNKKSKKSSKSSKSVTKKVIMKGSAPVDEHFPHKDSCHVYENNGIVWDAMLNQTNIANNNNKYYKLQILEKDSGGQFFTWFKWGRVGYRGQNTLLGPDSNTDRAIREFKKKFKAKTNNNWDDRNDFTPYARKYTYLPMDYSNDKNDDSESDSDNENESDSKVESKLDKTVQILVEMIFDKKMMETQMKEIGYDAEKLPLGKVSKRVIEDAYNVLKEIEDEINSSKKSNRIISDLSSTYYTLIPHTFGFSVPPPINTKKMLEKEMQLVEALQEIEIASTLLKDKSLKGESIHPIDKHYNQLKCEVIPIDRKSNTYIMLEKYVQRTHASTHNAYTLTVGDVFELKREGEDNRFKEFENNHNRMLLWHGSRLTNFVGIISQGLRIAPPEAPVTGYMFGKGVYFADMCSKSANYCWTSPTNNEGLILLCEVALGDCNELLQSNYYANQLPDGKMSTKGVGRTYPDPNTYITMDNGCVIPTGKSLSRPSSFNGALRYNEYIVYDTSQIRMKYLLRLTFNYKNNWGW